ISQGNATVQATVASGVTCQKNINVTSGATPPSFARCEATPNSPSYEIGESGQVNVVCLDDQIPEQEIGCPSPTIWSSSPSAPFTTSNEQATSIEFTANSAGTGTITAEIGGQTCNADIEVTSAPPTTGPLKVTVTSSKENPENFDKTIKEFIIGTDNALIRATVTNPTAEPITVTITAVKESRPADANPIAPQTLTIPGGGSEEITFATDETDADGEYLRTRGTYTFYAKITAVGGTTVDDVPSDFVVIRLADERVTQVPELPFAFVIFVAFAALFIVARKG
ncbi:MAG: hypothetical protein NUV67_04525, partial [archaeon]|nr:hypothetical protein [archaeon]